MDGGYFALSPKVLDHVADDAVVFEKELMKRLAADGELMAYRHARRDKEHLGEMWASGDPPWGVG